MSLQIAFIGAGNMATSIIGGLIDQGHDPTLIRVGDPDQDSLVRLQSTFDVHCHASNSEAIADADVVILAVKPQVMGQVIEDIRAAVAKALVVSIAAGITIASMEKGLGDKTPIVRCMPNTPALLRTGATAMYANSAATEANRTLTQHIFNAVGNTCWVDSEELLDAVTALSGSGPAYFFLFMESMIAAGETLGLDPETSRALAVQTCAGAARMAAEGNDDLAELRRRVTSPGGTTERAMRCFEDANLRDIVAKAMQSAWERAREMSRDMG